MKFGDRWRTGYVTRLVKWPGGMVPFFYIKNFFLIVQNIAISWEKMHLWNQSIYLIKLQIKCISSFNLGKSHVSANNKNLYVAWPMCHVYKFIGYSFVELKLKIDTRSLFNRTLNPAHPPLFCCALLALRSIQLMTGEPRSRYNAIQLLGVSGACVTYNCHNIMCPIQ